MRILVLCHRLPYPPNKGDKIRSFHEIRHLAERHQIHLLSFADPDQSGTTEEGLREYCAAVEVFPLNRRAAQLRCLAGALGTKPLTLSYFRSLALARRVEELAGTAKFDTVMACGSAMAQYAERAAGIPRLLDMVDVDSVKWEQYSQHASWPKSFIWRLEARRLSRYESSLAESFDRIVLTTSNDAEKFSSIAHGAESSVVRNGIDLDIAREVRFPKAAAPTLVFTGQMDYFANVDGVVHFATKVFPILRANFPDLRFLIVGRSPTREVVSLSRLPGVRVTGEVDDVRPYLTESWVFIAPLRIAQGVQNKVLEAMAMGIPAVVSQRVMAGLADGGFRDGRDVLVAVDEQQTVIALERLLRDEKMRASLASSARSRLAASYSWAVNMNTLEQQLEELVQSAAAAYPYSESESAELQPV
ncbi:MAG: TIGR03087 family PEP-CTERM/XrtA system glycosyltransferase [Thermoanaerobaculia bacterium]